MIKKKKVLCIIPARKGSKGLKNKNLKKLNKFSLIDWAIKCALGSKHIDDIILSTDYEYSKLSKLSQKYYKKRNKILAKDNSLSFDVIKKILIDKINENIYYDIIVLLEPPAPFRNSILVDKCIKMLQSNNASSVVTLKKIDDYHPIRVKKFINKNQIADFVLSEPSKGLPRQKQENAFIRDTSVYVFKTSNFLDGNNLLYGKKKLGIHNKNQYSINIDNELDFYLAELILKKKLISKTELPI